MRYLAALALLVPSVASAATYQVGPTRAIKAPADVAARLLPGDVVEIDPGSYGSAWFNRSGTAAAPITLRGVGATRPVLRGGDNTLHVQADWYVIEHIELTGGLQRCYFHHGANIIMRDSVVHDCPNHGILGADNDSGSLTLETTEVYRCGAGDTKHQVYMATDEGVHPKSVFRMQHCWVHDSTGGIGVKSRAERNEIYYNWFEGNTYYDLDLIGSQEYDEGVAREDSDVLGNVMIRANEQSAMRLGGDGSGESYGRYRVAWNTFITRQVQWGSPVVRLRDGIESVAFFNNVILSKTTVPADIFRDVDAVWRPARAMSGAGNWTQAGATMVPAEWQAGISGAPPAMVPTSALGPARPSPIGPPTFSPAKTGELARANALDVGAFAAPVAGGTTSAASTGAGPAPPVATDDPNIPYVWPIAGGAVMTLAGFLTWLALRTRKVT